MTQFASCIVFLMASASIGAAAARPGDEPPKLEPWAHTSAWEEFALSKDAPTSGDGRFRLQRVGKSGEVEVIYTSTSETRQVIVVKPMPKEFKKGERPPTIVVKAFDAEKQSAILRELRIK